MSSILNASLIKNKKRNPLSNWHGKWDGEKILSEIPIHVNFQTIKITFLRVFNFYSFNFCSCYILIFQFQTLISTKKILKLKYIELVFQILIASTSSSFGYVGTQYGMSAHLCKSAMAAQLWMGLIDGWAVVGIFDGVEVGDFA